jgi:EAL domain-containing protein (putative c-di-GMP-specific phosphodiesterase class I)/GGDEF domain-containing protein
MLASLKGGAETVGHMYPGIEIIMYDNMDECVKALRKGEVDALLHNSYVWSYVLQKPSYSDLKVQPTAMFAMDFRAGALDTPEGRAIIDRLNKGIDSLTDTQRQAVFLDYTSRQLYQYDLSDYLYRYWMIVIFVIILISLIIVIAVQKNRADHLKHEEELRKLVDHDHLTGALSLNGFKKRTEELIRSHPDVQYLLSYNNVKNFKFINESLGRNAGDDLLRFWVSRAKETLSDEEAIGRIYGDRIVVLRRAGGDERINTEDYDVIDSVRNYFIDRGKEIRIQLSTGVYMLMPEDYQNPDTDRMIDYARVAEKRLRDSEGDGYEFYNPEQWEKGKRAAEIISRLPEAIKNEKIQVWYQPQVDYTTGRITGAEALCRWHHDKLGWISPGEFIPVLEEASLIFDLDSYVWETVCRDIQRWNAQGSHVPVSVNLSRNDIKGERNIPECFNSLIEKYGLDVDQLRIEITETAYVEDPDVLISITERLRDLGFHVEMDDFGSGYSSLHMLKEVPVDRIKLDLHFLARKGDPERARIIIRHITQMIGSLGMDMITEGVETKEQAEFLYSTGCSEMQGYYFHKPMPVQEFEKVLDNNHGES